MDRPAVRVAVACLLLVLVGAQLVVYAAGAEHHSEYPRFRELQQDSPAHHGQAVAVWVTPTARTEDGFRTAVGWTVTLADPHPALDVGDSVQVYGVARPGPRIEARRVVVTDAANRTYLWAASVVGLALMVALGLWHWRPTRNGFAPRGGDGA